MTIEQLTTSGGDLTLTAEGTVQLAPDPGDSELAIQLHPIDSPRRRLAFALLLAILPHPPGPEPYHLTGTLNAPRIS